MNTTAKTNWIFNPFVRIAGWKAFSIGLGITVLATIIGYFCNIGFPGALDIKYSSGITLVNAFMFQVIGIVSLVLVLYVAGLIFSKNVRFQDILGSVTLARYPYLLVAPLGLLMEGNEVIKRIEENPFQVNSGDLIALIPIMLFGLLMSLFVIWFIILLYNGFKVSTNLKGIKAGVMFAVCIIIAEVISLISLSFIL